MVITAARPGSICHSCAEIACCNQFIPVTRRLLELTPTTFYWGYWKLLHKIVLYLSPALSLWYVDLVCEGNKCQPYTDNRTHFRVKNCCWGIVLETNQNRLGWKIAHLVWDYMWIRNTQYIETNYGIRLLSHALSSNMVWLNHRWI